jgi:hypothetical protein
MIQRMDTADAAPQRSRPSRAHWAMVIAFAVLSAAVMIINRDPFNVEWRYSDERHVYIPTALLILEEGLEFFTENPHSMRVAPLSPLWTAAWGANYPHAVIANALLVACGGLLVWLLARRLCQPRGALLISCLYFAYPQLNKYGPTVLTEPLFLFLIVAGLWLLVKSVEQNGCWRWGIAAGVVFALASLTRPIVQLFPPFALCVLALLWCAKWLPGRVQGWLEVCMPPRRNVLLLTLLALSAPFALLCGAYIAKNKVCFDRAAIANGLGAGVYLGSDPRRHGDEPPFWGFRYDTGAHTKPYSHLDSEGDARLRAVALSRMRQRPADSAVLVLRKFIRYLCGSPHAFFPQHENIVRFAKVRSSRQTAKVLFHLGCWLFAVVFGIWGAAAAARRNPCAWVLSLFVVYMVAIHSVVYAIHRYALPIYPCLLVLAAAAVSNRYGVTARQRTAAAAAVMVLALYTSLVALGWGPDVSFRYRSYFAVDRSINVERVLKSKQMNRTADGTWRAEGGDPYLVYAVESVGGRLNQVFFLEAAMELPAGNKSGRAKMQIFWGDGSGFAEARSMVFEVIPDGRQRVYMVNPSQLESWKQTISQVRLDGVDGARGAVYSISRLELRR